MDDPKRFRNIAPVFVSANVQATVNYYVEVLGFKYSKHFDKRDVFASIYRDKVEIIVVQRRTGEVQSNETRYGAGYDAYINPSTLEGVEQIYQEYREKGVLLLTSPHRTEYGSVEFAIEDIDGRRIGIGLISDTETHFEHSDYLGPKG